jgi:hypothetical protein
MSWTVQEDPSKEAQALHETNLEQLLQKVVDDDDDYVPSPNKSTAALAPCGAQQSLYTKSSQVFTSPAPLVPADLATPVKDPLESFNSWVRTQGGQTPNSSRSSPTPGGMGASPSNATSPPSAGRHAMQATALPYVVTTPQKSTPAQDLMMLTPTAATNAARATVPLMMPQPQPHGRPALDNIIEHRKLLLQQMEELALQEMELRQLGSNVAAAPFQPMAHHSHDAWSMHQPHHGQTHVPYAPTYSPSAVTMVGNPAAHPQVLTAESIRGRVYETAKDQHGCRFLQRWLDNNFDGDATQAIMTEIIPHVAELMTDQYANFLVQKLFDIMPHDVRYSVAQVAAPHLSLIALTPHGTFSVQKLIETIATREEMEIVREALTFDVVRLVKDVHGNHVIQKVLQRFEHPDKQFIYDAVSDDCAAIATNKQGCCVLQRCLEFASPMQHKSMVACILSCCLQIVQDPFGNYVLQYVLEANDPSINDRIATIFLHHLVPLSMNKFSSNVMEKVLRGASQHVRDTYVDTMKDPNIIGGLIQDDFGNYVVQTALTMSSAPQAESLVAVIRPLMPLIRNAPYAKKLEAKMDLIMKKKAGHGSGPNGPNGGRSSNNFQSPSSAGMRNMPPHDPYDQTSIQSPHHHQQLSPNHHQHHHSHRGFGNSGQHRGTGGHHHSRGVMPPPQHMTPWSNNAMAM